MGVIATATKTVVIGLLLASVAFIVFAMTLEEDDIQLESKPTHGLPMPFTRRFGTVAPVVKPKRIDTPYKGHVGEKYNLRECECRKDWESLPADTPGLCRCKGVCPSFVTPGFLTQAAGQALCSLEEETGFNCHAECQSETNSEIKWYASPCGPDKMPCDRRILAGLKEKKQEAPPPPPPPPEEEKPQQPPENKFAKLGYDPKDVYDLRGLQCELLNGKERCFYEDSQGRELCPEYVTAEWLAFPNGQYLCSAEMAAEYFCTVGCQEGNPEVKWGANEVAWCEKNGNACPPRPSVIPKAQFKLQPWTAVERKETACQAAWRQGEKVPVIPNLTMGMLTHEPKSMKDSLDTYEKLGLFDVVTEFLIYINKRKPEIDEVLQPFLQKYATKIKVMGDANNYGIARGISFLTGNASHENFLFLERDFQLIEPATCVYEQLMAGIQLLEAGDADVVRYRHRRHPGRPNWAERMFKGHEDDVFKGSQPNLFCNHYYWVEDPDKRWPDKMWICNKTPVMYCSDSYYCNWTNNPQLWKVSWWNKEYVEKFDHFQRNDPYYDLESYMNWEPNSWNDRKFTVAQGEGLFKHVDRGNFGV